MPDVNGPYDTGPDHESFFLPASTNEAVAGDLGDLIGERDMWQREATMWRDLLREILTTTPEQGLPPTTIHRPPGEDGATLVMYYTRYELSETETEMLVELTQ